MGPLLLWFRFWTKRPLNLSGAQGAGHQPVSFHDSIDGRGPWLRPAERPGLELDSETRPSIHLDTSRAFSFRCGLRARLGLVNKFEGQVQPQTGTDSPESFRTAGEDNQSVFIKAACGPKLRMLLVCGCWRAPKCENKGHTNPWPVDHS
jgi:hypothetical protein